MNICMISLGCDKNLVDSEMMLGFIDKNIYQITDDEDDADIIIVNTCCFILDAKEESIQAILDAADKKKNGKAKVVIVTGCMSQRYKHEIIDEIPEVDAILGTASYDEINEAISKALAGNSFEAFESLDRLPECSKKRLVSTGGWYAYLKIAEGCDKHCTYCIIPSLRGDYRSYPMDTILEQAAQLAEAGTKELILVAQETTVYGVDIYKKKMLPELLHKLGEIDGIEWIRILYCYPEEITDELIEEIRDNPKVCHYLDIPIQHASDIILKRMGRRTDRADLENVISKLRTQIPDIVLRTTLISGFPGESQADHDELCDFVSKMKFEKLGVFPYSAEEGTPAAEFADQIPDDLKESRRDEIMTIQQGISKDFLSGCIGRELQVIIEGKLADEDAYVGRTYMDTPGVDGYIFINSTGNYNSGDMITVKITGSSEYDLIGDDIR